MRAVIGSSEASLWDALSVVSKTRGGGFWFTAFSFLAQRDAVSALPQSVE